MKWSLSPPITKVVLAAGLMLFGGSILSAAVVDCSTLTNLQALITQSTPTGNRADGCFSQDKLFWNFSYTSSGNSPNAAGVSAAVIQQIGSGVDIHGWNFSAVWAQAVSGAPLSPFSVSFTIQVCQAADVCFGNVTPGTLINLADATYAPSAVSPAGPETVTWSNGSTVTLSSGNAGPLPANGIIGLGSGVSTPITVTASFSGTGAITQTALRFYETVPTGVPEPATMLMFGLGLAGLGIIKRSRRA